MNCTTFKASLLVSVLLALSFMSMQSMATTNPCSGAIKSFPLLKLTAVQGMNSQLCDRPNIQAAIDGAGTSTDAGNRTILLTGIFQLDGTVIGITKSNLTLSGVPIIRTKLKGLLDTSGLPLHDKGGYSFFNRPIIIGPNLTTGLTNNVTVANLYLTGFQRAVAVSTSGTSNLCRDAISGGKITNVKIVLNKVDNTVRSPQVFGDGENVEISFNDFSTAEGVILAGGSTACFPLVGDLKVKGAGAGQTFVYPTGLTHQLVPDPVTHICNNNGTPQLLAVNVGGNYICPVCADDATPALGGNVSSRCGPADSRDIGNSNHISVIGNRMKADPALLAVGYEVDVGSISTQGFNDNVLIALNDMSQGNFCLAVTQQDPAGTFEVKNNFFHDCGAPSYAAGLRFGAVSIGDPSAADSDRLFTSSGGVAGTPFDPTQVARGIYVHDNLYFNNIANLNETSSPIFDLGMDQTTLENNPLYAPVRRDIWLGERTGLGNKVKENLCVVKVLDQNVSLPLNIVGVACPH